MIGECQVVKFSYVLHARQVHTIFVPDFFFVLFPFHFWTTFSPTSCGRIGLKLRSYTFQKILYRLMLGKKFQTIFRKKNFFLTISFAPIDRKCSKMPNTKFEFDTTVVHISGLRTIQIPCLLVKLIFTITFFCQIPNCVNFKNFTRKGQVFTYYYYYYYYELWTMIILGTQERNSCIWRVLFEFGDDVSGPA